MKLSLDSNDIWNDLVAQYKSPNMNYSSKIRIKLDGQPAIDTGGVRRHVYTTMFEHFANNTFMKMFDGPPNYLRPACTAEVRSSGLLKVLGSMISHGFCQGGLAFPFISPTCIVGGEEKAIEFVSTENLPADTAALISQACTPVRIEILKSLLCA